MCRVRQRVSVILEVFVSSSGGNVQPRRGEQQLMSLLSPDSGADRRQKKTKTKRQGSVALTYSLEAARSMTSPFTCAKKKKRGKCMHNTGTKEYTGSQADTQTRKDIYVKVGHLLHGQTFGFHQLHSFSDPQHHSIASTGDEGTWHISLDFSS